LSKGFSAFYVWLRARKLEGTHNDDPKIGAWPISALRVQRGWGNVGEERWPYDGSGKGFPPKEPPHLDHYAKAQRIFGYKRIRSIDECKRALFSHYLVSVAVEITEEWFSAKNGEIPVPKTEDEIVGGHVFRVTGYDDSKQRLRFANSWGVDWGDKGYGYLPYAYFEWLMTEAWIIAEPQGKEIEKSAQSQKGKGGVEMFWRVPLVLHEREYLYGGEIRDIRSDDRKGWAFASEYDGFLDVEELFVKPKYRGKGYSKQLISILERVSERLSVPLRFWVSHPDNEVANMKILRNLCHGYGWRLSYSEVRWADYRIDTDRVSVEKKAMVGVEAVSMDSKNIRTPVQHVPSASLADIGSAINEGDSVEVGPCIDSTKNGGA
jgi:GNAT superfamily N-acetyltransferase